MENTYIATVHDKKYERWLGPLRESLALTNPSVKDDHFLLELHVNFETVFEATVQRLAFFRSLAVGKEIAIGRANPLLTIDVDLLFVDSLQPLIDEVRGSSLPCCTAVVYRPKLEAEHGLAFRHLGGFVCTTDRLLHHDWVRFMLDHPSIDNDQIALAHIIQQRQARGDHIVLLDELVWCTKINLPLDRSRVWSTNTGEPTKDRQYDVFLKKVKEMKDASK